MLDELQNIDTSAIEDLCTIKAEQETLQDRLQRMKDRRESVSDLVYARVHGDYEARHGQLEDQARPLKQQARAEFAKLRTLIEAMTEALDAARLAREELEFRHELGEFKDGEFDERLEAAIAEVERCAHELGEAEALRGRFVEAFHSEDELTAVEPGDAPPAEGGEAAAGESAADDDNAVAHDATADAEPFGELAAGAPETWDEDALATDDLPADSTAEHGIDDPGIGGAPTSEAAEGELDGEDEGSMEPPEGPPELAATPSPAAMMDDLPTGRMEVMAPEMPPPPVPPPPAPEPEGSEATAMFSLARLVGPGSDDGEEEHILNPTETTIGRAPGNHIQINDGAISRQHAKIVGSLEGAFTVYDLGSENGVYVNRERVVDRRLKDGDIIEIGPGTRTYIYRGP